MAEEKKVTEKVAERLEKANAVVAQQETAKVSFADKRLAKAQEQASEGKFFRAGFNRLIGNIAKHPVATGVIVTSVVGAGAVGYALGANSGNDDDIDPEATEELGDVEIIEEPVE